MHAFLLAAASTKSRQLALVTAIQLGVAAALLLLH